MGRKPVRAVVEDHQYNLVLRIPGWFKNELVDFCAEQGVSMNQWAISAIRDAMMAGKGIPEPPPAKVPLPGLDDQIRLWAAGERIMMPCGRFDECPGSDSRKLGGMRFCPECNIRIT